MEVLVGIVVVHILGHVELHALHQIHQLHEHLQLHLHIEIRLEADELLDPVGQGVNAVAGAGVDGVDLLDVPLLVDHGVPGDGHNVDVLLLGVVADHHEGVRVAVVLVGAHQQEGIHALLPVAGDGGHVAVVPVVGIELIVRGSFGLLRLLGLLLHVLRRLDGGRDRLRWQGGRLDPHFQHHGHRNGEHRQTSQHRYQDLALSGVPEGAPPGRQIRLFRLLPPYRLLREGVAQGGGPPGKGRIFPALRFLAFSFHLFDLSFPY